jgi:DNA polymerase I
MDRATLAIGLVDSARVIAFDVETTGLDAFDDHPIGVVVTSPEHSLYIPTEHSGGGNEFDDPAPFYKALARAFAKRSRLGLLTVGHNLAYDCWMIAKRGIILDAPLEDTMVNSVLIDDSEYEYGLAVCAERYGAPAKKGEELDAVLAQFARKGEKNIRKYMHRLPGDNELVQEYASADGIATLALWRLQQTYLDDRDLRRVHALECKLIPHLARMRRRGIRIDHNYGSQAIFKVREVNRALRMPFPAGFQPMRPAHVLPWLKTQGIHDFPLTGLGRESTAAAFLETTQAGQMVLDLRRLEKVEGTFIRPLLGELQRNGRIYPELVQAKSDTGRGTHTGRFSCVGPNMQQVPKRDVELARIVRPLIIPDPGFEIAESDVSQQEVRLYAHYAQEQRLLDAYLADPPIDVHVVTRDLLGLPKTKEGRQTAKTLGLSIFNGLQPVSLAVRLKVSLPQAEDYHRRFFEAYPAIRDFTFAAPSAAARYGYVRTTLGRIAHLRWDERRVAVSRIIQGSGADQLKLLLLRACEYADAYPHIQVLMTVHDSLLWQRRLGSDSSEFERVLEDNSELYQIIDGVRVPMRIPFPMETDFGLNWAEASLGD